MARLSETKQRLLQVRESIVEAYSNGLSLRNVAEAYETSVTSIRSLLVESGVALKGRGRPKKKEDA